jgi:hypothetical protein
MGKVQPCDFPSSWDAVASLKFNIVKSTLSGVTGALQSIKDYLGLQNAIGGSAGALGAVGFVMDDLSYVENCKEGAKNDAATGQCKPCEECQGTRANCDTRFALYQSTILLPEKLGYSDSTTGYKQIIPIISI